MDRVSRKTCPDISCPFLRRGVATQLSAGAMNGVANKLGWVDGDNRVFCRQYSLDRGMIPPVGNESIHSPPDKAITRSNTAGPKNQLVNIAQMAVPASHLNILSFVCALDGLVKYRKKKAAEVHPHAFFMNRTFSQLDLLAK